MLSCLVLNVFDIQEDIENWITTAGGDALRGHTRSHPEHDG